MNPDRDNVVEAPGRDPELGAALAALPHPELPGDMDARLRGAIETERRRRRRHRSIATLGLAATLAAVVLGGAALAGAFDSNSHRPPPKVMLASPLTGSPTPYPTNSVGQTYGGGQEGIADPVLQGVVAMRGENGYCWTSDLDGPQPISLQETAWLGAVLSRREVAVYKADGVTQVGIFIVGGGSMTYGEPDGTTITKALPNRIAKQPPVWLFDQMKGLATDAGDANAWAWWTLTTADKAAAAAGDSVAQTGDPTRPVYVAIILGDFTNWLWSLPKGASAPQYSWIYEVIDAVSREVDGSGASAKPFTAAEKLELNIVGLRDRIRM